MPAPTLPPAAVERPYCLQSLPCGPLCWMQMHGATIQSRIKETGGVGQLWPLPLIPRNICASFTYPHVASLSGPPVGFTRLPPERNKGQVKPKSLEMLAMCYQWEQRMESPSLNTAPVFTSECGWGCKVLSFNSLS